MAGWVPRPILIGAEGSPPYWDSVPRPYSPWRVSVPTIVFQPRPNDGCIKTETFWSFNEADIHINSYVYFGGSF
jgi:hypothetical protein